MPLLRAKDLATPIDNWLGDGTSSGSGGAPAGRVRETTLYPFLQNYLSGIPGVTAISSLQVQSGETDILVDIEGTRIIIEAKITDSYGTFMDAILQANRYTQDLGTPYFVVIAYPPSVRMTPLIENVVKDVSLNTPLRAFILTRGWRSREDRITFTDLAQKIAKTESDFKRRLVPVVNYDAVIEVARTSIESLAEFLRIHHGLARSLSTVAVGRFDLYRALMSEAVKEEELDREAQALVWDLTAYVIVNQVLFYHIVQRKRGGLDELPDVSPLQPPDDLLQQLRNRFRQIRRIDYEPIYDVKALDALLEGLGQKDQRVINALARLVYVLKRLEPEHVSADLLGKLYHDTIPPTTRKRMGAFYTNPTAAALLAHLAIDDWKAKVYDPACGSGSLLVASYYRKKTILETVKGAPMTSAEHKAFVQNDIFGTDIMPFAAHISSANLLLQKADAISDKVNIRTGDSLAMMKSDDSGLPKLDAVTMNPPFTDFRRLPDSEREKLREDFGKANYNYWAYFLLASDPHVTDGGSIAAVLPDGFFRGSDTNDIRALLLKSKKYTLDTVVKSCVEIAFSERAFFRDYLVIMKKQPPSETQSTYVVLVKKKLHDLPEEQVHKIAESIQENRKRLDATSSMSVSQHDFTIVKMPYKNILSNTDNLYPPVAFLTERMYLLFLDIISALQSSGVVVRLNELEERGDITIRRYNPGEYVKPSDRNVWTEGKEIARQLFIARNKYESGKWAFLISKEDSTRVHLKLRKSTEGFALPRAALLPAIRTYSGVRQMDVSQTSSYVIKDPQQIPSHIVKLLGWSKDALDHAQKDINSFYRDFGSNLVLAHKIQIPSPRLFWVSFYSDVPMASSFMNVRTKTREEAKMLAAWSNSILGLIQLTAMRSEIRGAWSALDKSSVWGQMLVPDFKRLGKKEQNALLTVFDKVGKANVVPMHERFATKSKEERLLDETVLKVVGMSSHLGQIEEAYAAFSQELQEGLNLMGGKLNTAGQTHNLDE